MARCGCGFANGRIVTPVKDRCADWRKHNMKPAKPSSKKAAPKKATKKGS